MKKREVNENSLANLKPFGPGNPGRPKGSRNKLGEKFIEDLYADWSENGVQALKECRETNPAAYVKTVASLLPKDVNINVTQINELADDDLAAALAAAREAIAIHRAVGAGAGTPDKREQAKGVQTLQ